MNFDNEGLKDKYGIYCIFNNITGDAYVGQTGQTFNKRFLHHRWKLRDGSHDNQHLQNAWNLYGEDNFSFIPLRVVDNHEKLDELEIKYINLYRQMNHCYNIINGGQSGHRGFHLSDEQKKKIGEKNKINMLGKKASDETKRKMSNARKGKVNLNNNQIKLTQELAFEIKSRLVNGERASDIAQDMGIDYKLINNIMSGNTWSSVVVDGWDDFFAKRKTYSRLSKEDHKEIYRLHSEEGLTKYQLAEMYNKGVKMIEKILRDGKKDAIRQSSAKPC